jgi:acyl carrier protein
MGKGLIVAETDTITATLLDIAGRLAREVHPYKNQADSTTLDSSLERDLGLDSLSRVELLLRLEQAFDLSLPEEKLLATAETLRDLLRVVQGAGPAGTPGPAPAPLSRPLGQVGPTPAAARTLVDVLHWHVQAHPERPHVHFLGEAGKEEIITYGDLYHGAAATAAGLHDRGLQPGQTVGLMLPTGRDFFEGFYGILLAGGIPVPIYPPMRRSQLEEHLRRQAGILANARTVMLITVPEARPLARLLRSLVTELHTVITVQELSQGQDLAAGHPVREHDIALVQYTSGSTGLPKGVVLSHANLLANISAMHRVTQTTSADVFVSWLPLYHDMGLIGAWLGSLVSACLLILMSPMTFLARPARWLRAIHEHRGTQSGGPNFAYEFCAKKIADKDLEGLDLSTWRLAFNGSEPVSPQTLKHFAERFAPYGFRLEGLLPVYGLAENTLGLAFPLPGNGPRVDRIKREPFQQSGQAVAAGDDDPQALSFVSCGRPLPGHEIRIVDTMGYEVAEGRQGLLEFRGPSATSGYLHNPEATRRLFHGEWLDSGDLAYIAEGEVYLTGRAKDLIIRSGRNLHPQELEEAAGNLPGVRKGCVAVFGSPDPVSGTERLVVLAETAVTESEEREALRRRIESLVVDLLGEPPDDVVLAPPHTVSKTSSGKIRRAASREIYENGRIGAPQTALWRQMMHLMVAGLRPRMRHILQTLGDVFYSAYVWILGGLFTPITWIGVALLPKRPWRQAMVRRMIRLAGRLAGIPVIVQGMENLRPVQPCVLVVNHASYLDPLVLMATLPGDFAYVAKKELTVKFLSRVPMERLGVEFVERFEALQGVEDTARITGAVSRGRPMIFFPEGTFRREPGLRSFHLGAFVVASQTGVPVIPLALRGTRSILRGDQWFFRRGAVHLIITPPIPPSGTDWPSVLKLRDAARAQILRHCGEPDLEPLSP